MRVHFSIFAGLFWWCVTRMMRLGDPDLRIGPAGLLAAVHESDDPRQVRLIGQQLQVIQQPDMLLEHVRNTGGLGHVGQRFCALFFRFLDSPLHVAKRSEIVVHLPVVGPAQLLLKLIHAIVDRIEKALVLAETRRAHARIRAVARSEHPLEEHARIVFGHQRQRRRQPGKRGAVGATVTEIAVSHQAVVVGDHLQRRELRVALECLRGNLVHGDAVLHGGCPTFLTCTPVR